VVTHDTQILSKQERIVECGSALDLARWPFGCRKIFGALSVVFGYAYATLNDLLRNILSNASSGILPKSPVTTRALKNVTLWTFSLIPTIESVPHNSPRVFREFVQAY
jgi:hypothetical protein